MARRWLKSGVLTGYLNALAVTADGTGMTVSVNTGGAWVEGFYFENDAAAVQTITAAHATLSRIDRIAVRLDRTANTVALVVLTGTAAASPVAPTLSVSDTLYEIGLATVLVDPAVGVIAAGKVTDTRTLVKNLTEADASSAYPSLAGGSVITASGAAVVPLAVKGAASQTANLFSARDSADAEKALITPAGLFFAAGGVQAFSDAAAKIPLLVRGNAAQTANLVEAQNSAATVLFSVGPGGALTMRDAITTGLDRALQFGAADSAGVGFRTVRVAN